MRGEIDVNNNKAIINFLKIAFLILIRVARLNFLFVHRKKFLCSQNVQRRLVFRKFMFFHRSSQKVHNFFTKKLMFFTKKVILMKYNVICYSINYKLISITFIWFSIKDSRVHSLMNF